MLAFTKHLSSDSPKIPLKCYILNKNEQKASTINQINKVTPQKVSKYSISLYLHNVHKTLTLAASYSFRDLDTKENVIVKILKTNNKNPTYRKI